MSRMWCLLTGALVVAWAASGACAGRTDLVSVTATGRAGNAWSALPSISGDGRYVAFASKASNLIGGDTNGQEDVFVRDLVAGSTERVSITSDGQNLGGPSVSPSMSDDGRYVAFQLGDAMGYGTSLWLRDREQQTTEQINIDSDGNDFPGFFALPAISADGTVVAFVYSYGTEGPTHATSEIWVRDREAGTLVLASVSTSGEPANNGVGAVAVSGDARFVAFSSDASNLVPDDGNGIEDVFVRDLLEGTTERISVSSAGQEGNDVSRWPSLSSDGRYVAFQSHGSNLVADDTNGAGDIFLRDRVSGTTTRVSLSSAGVEADGPSYVPKVSGDGRFVVFASSAANLVPRDENATIDVFLRDVDAASTIRISVGAVGTEGDGESEYGVIGATADVVAFESTAASFAADDANGTLDVFVRYPFVQTFSDVPIGFWAYDNIDACAAAGIISGYADGTYHPGDPVTRDQMAVYISRALAGGDEGVPEFTGTPTFSDVGAQYWALDYVEHAAEQSVIAGYGDGTYHPQEQVNRAQMAVYVARALVAPTGEAALADYVPADPRNFPDVPSDHWAYTHIEYCVEHGVVSGYLDGSYHPEAIVTRDQMAVYVARAFGLLS